MELLNKLMAVKEAEPDSDHDMMKLTDKDNIEVCWMTFERLADGLHTLEEVKEAIVLEQLLNCLAPLVREFLHSSHMQLCHPLSRSSYSKGNCGGAYCRGTGEGVLKYWHT